VNARTLPASLRGHEILSWKGVRRETSIPAQEYILVWRKRGKGKGRTGKEAHYVGHFCCLVIDLLWLSLRLVPTFNFLLSNSLLTLSP